MLNLILLYSGGALTGLWGIAHLFPTRSVVDGFGDISMDNRRIIMMEWINEGLCLLFIGVIIVTVTCLDHTNTVSMAVYWLSFVMLNVMSVTSFFTGFKVAFLPFKLCPFIFTGSSLLILLGGCI